MATTNSKQQQKEWPTTTTTTTFLSLWSGTECHAEHHCLTSCIIQRLLLQIAVNLCLLNKASNKSANKRINRFKMWDCAKLIGEIFNWKHPGVLAPLRPWLNPSPHSNTDQLWEKQKCFSFLLLLFILLYIFFCWKEKMKIGEFTFKVASGLSWPSPDSLFTVNWSMTHFCWRTNRLYTQLTHAPPSTLAR